ncbi:hypothetical protein HUJ04_013572 [Dendroctonus ponderosae]|nr:hypothetical protein HUJ04_013572 [Dendroctonus ponderosae]
MNFQVVLFLSVSLLFLQQSSASPVGSKLDHRSENPQSSGFIVASIINVPCKTGYVMVNGNCVKEVNGKWSPEKSSKLEMKKSALDFNYAKRPETQQRVVDIST